MPDRIDAEVNPMEGAARDACAGARPAQAQLSQLMYGDHPVLAGGEASDGSIQGDGDRLRWGVG